MKTDAKFARFSTALFMLRDLMKLIEMPDEKNKEERKKIICLLIDAEETLRKIEKEDKEVTP